ncbi:MAG: hypothetical protein R8M45_03660 [Ghiorsea sp.]
MTKIVAIKLKSGEELVSELVVEAGAKFTIKNPITFSQTQEGNMSMMPWFPFAKTREFQFDINDTLFCTEAIDKVIESYKQAFGMIVTPERQIIV